MFWQQQFRGWRFNVDEGGGGSPSTPPPSGAEIAPAAPVESAPTSSVSQPVQSAPAPSAPAQPSFRDQFRQYGYDTSHYQNDQAAMADLALQLRQAQQMAERVRPQWSQFEQWQAQQAQAQRAPEKPWFEAPEYDPRWKEAIGYDPAGNAYLKPGYPADTIQKIQAWNQHYAEFQQKMARDPIGTIRPGIEQVVQEVASKMMQQQLGQYQEQQLAQRILSQNAPWMHQVDPQTQQPVTDPMGRPVLSEWGNRYKHYVGEAVQLGLGNTAAQHKYAERAVMSDMAMTRLQQQNSPAAAQAAGEAAKSNFIAQTQTRQPNQGGAVPSQGGTQPRQQLSQMMAARLAAAGINPNDQVN